MKYSVIIPAYNSHEYIDECICSVVSQNRPDVEIIVINDGSTDNTLEICEKYIKNGVKIIDKKNTGSMDSWIIGVKSSVGKYICFLDSDDTLEMGYFNRLDDYVDDYDIVLFDFFRMFRTYKKPEKINKLNYGRIDESILHKLKKDYFRYYKYYSFYRWDKVIRADIIKNNINKIDCRSVYFEDIIIGLLNLSNSQKIYYLNNRLYNYRMRKMSVSHGFNDRIFEDNILIEQEAISIVKRLNYGKNALKKLHLYFLFQYARWDLKSRCIANHRKVKFSDVICIDGGQKKVTLLLYKFKMFRLFNFFNNIRHNSKANTEEFF